MNSSITTTKDNLDSDYERLVANVGVALYDGRNNIAIAINTNIVQTYWEIGKYIVEYEQKGKERAEYGSNLLNRLSADLTRLYEKGFGKSNLLYIRKLYITYPNSGTLSHLLSWSHYYEILKIDDSLERSFYMKECEKQHWSIRELKRQIKSMLFHRIALSRDKAGVLELVERGNEVQKPEDILRDPFVLEFTGIPAANQYEEDELEEALVSNLGQFLLELGRGFAFIGQQYHFSIAGRHYYVDLVFYHVVLKTYVLIDLKRAEVSHEDVGQMNFYLNYFRGEMCGEDDNEPIGIVLGASADKMTMEYAIGNITNQLFVSRYQLYLPDREMIEKELWRIMQEHEANTNQE